MTEDGLLLGLDEDLILIDELEVQMIAQDKELHERRRAHLLSVKTAFIRVFAEGNSTADDRATVLNNLKTFCRFDTSTFHPNVQMAARLDGRREVALRINEYLDLPVDALLQRKLGPTRS